MQTKRRASKTTLRKKNILTVPREIADRMHLAEGDEFIVTGVDAVLNTSLAYAAVAMRFCQARRVSVGI